MRFAFVANIERETLSAYLPANYSILGPSGHASYVIYGVDMCGWILDSYVLTRLASGMYMGRELLMSDPLDADAIDHAFVEGTLAR